MTELERELIKFTEQLLEEIEVRKKIINEIDRITDHLEKCDDWKSNLSLGETLSYFKRF